jgi:hypothetical protein
LDVPDHVRLGRNDDRGVACILQNLARVRQGPLVDESFVQSKVLRPRLLDRRARSQPSDHLEVVIVPVVQVPIVFVEGNRKEEAGLRAVGQHEIGGQDSHNREGPSVYT